MKYLPLLLILTACGPKFKAGDCIVYETAERWHNSSIYEIVDIGRHKYLYRLYGGYIGREDYISLVDNNYRQIACPEPEQPDPTRLPWKGPRPR